MSYKRKTESKISRPAKAKATINYKKLMPAQTNYGWIGRRNSPVVHDDGATHRKPSLMGLPRYEIIKRARALFQSNPYANLLIKKATTNIVGDDGYKLAVSSESNPEWADRVEKTFRDWTYEADIQGFDWITHQTMVCNQLLSEGDLAVLLNKEYERGGLQIIPAASIRSPDELGENQAVIDGIEVNNVLAPVAVHMVVGDPGSFQTKRTPIDYACLIANSQTCTDIRGIPPLIPYIDLFNNLEAINRNFTESTNIQAMHCYQLITDKDSLPARGQFQQNQQTYMNIDGVNMFNPAPGQRLEMLTPEIANIDIDKVNMAVLKIISMSLGIPIEAVFTSLGNYSSSQLAVMDAYKAYKSWQNILVHRYYQKMFKWWLKINVKDGLLPEPPADFSFRWLTPSYLFVNRVESTQADLLEIECGFATYKEKLANRGKDYEETIKQLKKEQEDRAKAGLPELPKSTFVQYAPEPLPAEKIDEEIR